jgi:hypothetical protein
MTARRKQDFFVLGLFDSVEQAAKGARALRSLPLPAHDITTLSSVPLPDGAVCEDTVPIRFPWAVAAFWFVGAAAGLGLSLVTYLDYPLITAGKAIISVPPTIIVTYEIAMLGALLATLVGSFRSIGLARLKGRKVRKVFDPRIHEGKIVLCARVEPGDQEKRASAVMKEAGGHDVRAEEGER